MKANVVRVHECGGPEVLKWETDELAAPGAGEVLVRNRAIGLNFLDVYYRTGRYKARLPFVPGNEGAGVVEAVGPDVKDFQVGDRVAYVDPLGAYADVLIRPASRLVKLPEGIDEVQAAGMMLKGMTAEYLLHRTYRVSAGETILVHAAAGGVGQILCQWASNLGAIVIGTVGCRDKAALAEQAGCAHVIVREEEDFVEAVRRITEGERVRVVYDGIGADTFRGSIDCLAPRGMLVAYGQSSGPIPPFDTQVLSFKGSLYLTRPGLFHYTSTTDELRQSAARLFEAVRRGAVKIKVNRTYPLREAAAAHRDLEARKLTGSTVLLP